jgi:hypothetical protein
MSVTDLEIKEATWGAWTILYAGAPSCACRLAAALLAVTRGTQAHPHWVPSDDLWRDRLAAWGPQPVPLPCCRKVKCGAGTPICYGVQQSKSAPMTTARA